MSKHRIPKRVVIYVRISKYRSDQTSTFTQERDARKFAEAKGWEVVGVFTDEGKSAYSKRAKRPGFNQALAMVNHGHANVLLVWKLDRFYRSGDEFHRTWIQMRDNGGELASVMEPWIDASTPEGRKAISDIAYYAEIESNNRSQRAIPDQALRIENGETPGGKRPYGFDRPETGERWSNTLVHNPTESKLIQTAARRILDGEPLKRVCRELAPVTILSDEKSVAMTPRGLRYVLTSPTTAGYRRGKDGELVKGCWKPIIDRPTYDRLVELFDDPARKAGRTNQVRHLLSGIMECDKCNKGVGIRKWKANPTKRQPYVQESWRYTCATCGNSVNAETANAIVTAELWRIVTPTVWADWQTVGHGWDATVIDNITRMRETITLREIAGEVSSEFAEQQIAILNEREARAKGELPLDLPAVEDIRQSWEDLSAVDKRRVVRHAFASIRLTNANGSRDIEKRIAMKGSK